MKKVKWLEEPEEHDYPAAESYLMLIYAPDDVRDWIRRLKNAPDVTFHAKDIFRASELPLLDDTNYHVKKDLKKIADGKHISPLLLVRDTMMGKVVIADGYHRLCAAEILSEDLMVPCRIV